MTDQDILDNAPEGATYISDELMYLKYSKVHSNYWWSLWLPDLNVWVDKVAVANGLRSLSDIKLIAKHAEICERHVSTRKYLEKRIAELEIICAAVAHVGVDFGYGKFEITNELIGKARLLTAPPEKGQ